MEVYALLGLDLLCFKSLQQLANDLSGEVIIAPGKKLEDLIHLAELCVDLLQQNEEHYAEEVVLHFSHSLLMSSKIMKPRSEDCAVTIDFIHEAAITSLSCGSNVKLCVDWPNMILCFWLLLIVGLVSPLFSPVHVLAVEQKAYKSIAKRGESGTPEPSLTSHPCLSEKPVAFFLFVLTNGVVRSIGQRFLRRLEAGLVHVFRQTFTNPAITQVFKR
uniref:MUN domain-containing protein n=1 Tax=Timema poppense TaxID=170557 RepID=A0A7R9CEZ6_TIMPO|nr:unnamed protein product [Timema poppensis]